MVQIFEALDHATGIALHQHFGDSAVFIGPDQLHPCHDGRHSLHAGIQRFHQPALLSGQIVGLPLNGVIFTQLIPQCFLKLLPGCLILHTADTALSHLNGFQDGTQDLFICFQLISPQDSMSEWGGFHAHYLRKRIYCAKKG